MLDDLKRHPPDLVVIILSQFFPQQAKHPVIRWIYDNYDVINPPGQSDDLVLLAYHGSDLARRYAGSGATTMTTTLPTTAPSSP
jgi:hypothetical protein